MSNGQLPSNVHVLKPRTLSLSDRLDRFLEQHALAPDEAPIRRDPTRPKAPGINAIKCASCGQMEYLSRDYCRCGHYLRGQLEDEFLLWQRELSNEHTQLTRFVDKRLKRLRYLFILSAPFLTLPMLYVAISSSGLSLPLFISLLFGILLAGIAARLESCIVRSVEASKRNLNSSTFDDFLLYRALNGSFSNE